MAEEQLTWAFQIGFVGSVTAGLGALLALDRDDLGPEFRQFLADLVQRKRLI